MSSRFFGLTQKFADKIFYPFPKSDDQRNVFGVDGVLCVEETHEVKYNTLDKPKLLLHTMYEMGPPSSRLRRTKEVNKMRFFKKFIALWLVTAVIFYLGNLLFGQYLVFGNVRANFWQAILVSSLIVGFVSAVVSEYSHKHGLPPNVWMLIYWAIVSLTIYAIARTPISEWVGIGIAAFWVALILGVVTHLGHHHTHKRLKKR